MLNTSRNADQMNNHFIRFEKLGFKFYAMLSQKGTESVVLLLLGEKGRRVVFSIALFKG